MKRLDFLKLILSTPLLAMGEKNAIAGKHGDNKIQMPVLFVGHGNPMNAIQENEITKGWRKIGQKFQPAAILCISAHWETRGTQVTMTPKPRTIYDFGGFPSDLYEVEYPVPGAPEIAYSVIENVKNRTVYEDHEWGLDHGSWSVLVKMFPNADIPVFQISLDVNLTLKDHYEFAKELSFLRKRGVLIIGSGNIVHNLRRANWNTDDPYDWASEFDLKVKKLIEDRDHSMLIKGAGISREASLSIPTAEHYLPMLYALALQDPKEKVTFFNEYMKMGSMSMRSFVIS